MIAERYAGKKMNNDEVSSLARNWIQDLENNQGKNNETQQAVVLMNFTQPAEVQWEFIVDAVEFAESDDALGSIAAGPVEHLLGTKGGDWIDRFEKKAQESTKFAWMITGIWQHMMSDEIWGRVLELQKSAPATWKN